MKESAEYLLNFSIPAGPTGPTGPGNETNICFASYGYTTSSGYLKINQSKLIPSSTNIYTVGSDSVDVEAGVYEITYCGFFKKTGTNAQATLNLVDISSLGTTILPDMGIHLAADEESTHFSNTAIFEFPSKRTIKTELRSINATSLEADSVNILIKKLE